MIFSNINDGICKESEVYFTGMQGIKVIKYLMLMIRFFSLVIVVPKEIKLKQIKGFYVFEQLSMYLIAFGSQLFNGGILP